jgi:hypothetical protein
MDYIDDFRKVPGALSLRILQADKVIVGVLEDYPGMVALALGVDSMENYYLLECSPTKARKVAASLMNKADWVEGLI